MTSSFEGFYPDYFEIVLDTESNEGWMESFIAGVQ